MLQSIKGFHRFCPFFNVYYYTKCQLFSKPVFPENQEEGFSILPYIGSTSFYCHTIHIPCLHKRNIPLGGTYHIPCIFIVRIKFLRLELGKESVKCLTSIPCKKLYHQISGFLRLQAKYLSQMISFCRLMLSPKLFILGFSYFTIV